MAVSKPSRSFPIIAVEAIDPPIKSPEPPLTSTNDPEKGITVVSPTLSCRAHYPSFNPILTIISSFTLTLSTWGFYNSTGILLSHLSVHLLPNTPLPILSLIPALNILFTLLLFFPLGPIYDTYGPLPLLIPGSLIYILSLLLLSICSSLFHFLLVYGVLSAIGMALLCTVANAMLNTFEGTGYRGLATGIALVGNPTGGIIFTFVFQAVLESLDWGDAMRIVAGSVGVLVAVGFLAFLPCGGLRERRIRNEYGHRGQDNDCDVSTASTNTRNQAPWWKFWHEKKVEGDWSLLRDRRFLWCMAGIALFEFVLVGAIGLLPTYALQQGFSTSVSFNVVAIVNAGSILGRLLSGPLSDHLGPYNTVLLCLIFISLLANFAFFLPTSLLPTSASSTSLILFYLYASLSGLGSGAVMSAAPLCIAALCPSHVYARWWGASQVGVAIACFLSVPLASIILSRVASSLFISFFGFVLFLSGLAFALARWEVLRREWMWIIRV
ncbi:uncharacterized protein EAF02_000038 [Botrytis sinoallii]|uniref:uncharacterized protein n=1 Tax=Botrytis sinoallii TaxID=1463999 RepID=UPI0019003B6B|nr:uncharacterized protein EAF02_000038 [Botrytis sinoallii]KAF7892500.1 hypothetical protein EAF02_000038 [Botrytis sinoallii]